MFNKSIEIKVVRETISALEMGRRRRLTCSEIIENNFMVDMAFEL